MSKQRILVTGGLGYIGSHTVVALCKVGYEPIIVDNLSNSSEKIVECLERLTGQPIIYEICDVRDTEKLKAAMNKYKPDVVFHFAGLKSISESLQKPIEYYSNNVQGIISLLESMKASDLSKIIFSSSATIYGAINIPATEDMQLGETTNSYGATKVICERLLRDISAAQPNWQVTILRYFNPIGAHQSGLIGENPNGLPNNLMPYLSRVASGKIKELKVYGDDYPTADGTGIRDYIHVMDIADGHVAALKNIKRGNSIYNLGTGNGTSVKEMISTFERVTGQKVPYTVVSRRPGDSPNVTADPSKAYRELGWKTKLTLEDMCRDEWNWQCHYPNGY